MKIHIFGVYGSGKTTFAKQLSKDLDIPVYELDDIKFISKWDKLRPIKERLKILKKITKEKKWIIEGCWGKDAMDSFEKADKIIFLDTPKIKCKYRAIKRSLIRMWYMNDSPRKGFMVSKNVSKHFKGTDKFVNRKEYLELLNKFKNKITIVKNNRDKSKIRKELKNGSFRFSERR